RVGLEAREISPALRARSVDRPQRPGRRNRRQHGELYPAHRGVRAPLSRPVAVGASPVEDAPAGGAAAVSVLNLRVAQTLSGCTAVRPSKRLKSVTFRVSM